MVGKISSKLVPMTNTQLQLLSDKNSNQELPPLPEEVLKTSEKAPTPNLQPQHSEKPPGQESTDSQHSERTHLGNESTDLVNPPARDPINIPSQLLKFVERSLAPPPHISNTSFDFVKESISKNGKIDFHKLRKMANEANLEVPDNLPRSFKNEKTQKFVRRTSRKVLSTPETKRSESSILSLPPN
jgi:hypothetical protein